MVSNPTTVDYSTFAGAKEGTWVRTQVVGPTKPTVTFTGPAGAAVTTPHFSDNIVTTTTDTLKVESNGAYTNTNVVKTVWTATPAVLGTFQTINGVQYIITNSLAATPGGTSEITTVTTHTKAKLANGLFAYVDQTTVAKAYTGEAFPTTSYTNCPATVTSYSRYEQDSELPKSTYTWNGLVDGVADWAQTVKPATSSILGYNNISYAQKNELVIKDDGTYTLTSTTTGTQAARAATDTSPAVLEGTTVETYVEKGSVVGYTYKNGTYEATAETYGTNNRILFGAVSSSTTRVGTGALISTSFPSTAYTASSTTTSYFGKAEMPYNFTKGSKVERVVFGTPGTVATWLFERAVK